MQNVYDIFIEKELMFVLSEGGKRELVSKDILEKTAIFINLYYEDSWEQYSAYIANIPKEISLYICSSNPALLYKAKESSKDKENMTFLGKENRGRDISALLITFGEIMLLYEYVCFIHDKKASFDYLEKDVSFWVENIWGNTLGSTEYIYEILNLLKKNNIGLLVPPEPLGKHFNDWYTNGWKKNFENTISLASELGLDADISKDKTPMAIGTVFWGKTDALRKLLKKGWRYSDFPDEPLPLDGTINHAIERILPFVAQDSGYDTGVIMSRKYASSMLLCLKGYMTNTYDFLHQKMKISFEHQLHSYDELKNTIERYFHEYKKVFIYGVGIWGMEFLDNLCFWGYRPDGFIVSDGHRSFDMTDDIKVYELSEIDVNEECGIFIAVNYDLQREIEGKLLERGLHNYYKLAVF
ncbi:MAG: rhamnan synthesis F family protein [Lachnospiraceae bacterium]|nr:rhamnan synthesis F family protein [Lachnospiraceae bacterium]